VRGQANGVTLKGDSFKGAFDAVMSDPRSRMSRQDEHAAGRPRLLVRSLRHGDAQIVELVGELDIEGAPLSRRALGRACSSAQPTVFLDLAGLTFMDSSGVHMIIEADRRLREEGRELVIVRAPKHVRRLLELCGLTGILHLAQGGPRTSDRERQVRLTQGTMAAAVRAMRSLDRQRLRPPR
jgi:anti-sigma B factor antagonist